MTGYYQDVEAVTFVASTNLSGLQHHIVDVVSAHKIDAAAANAGYGVLLNKPQAGEAGTVAINGRVKVKAGKAVAVNDLITAAASGWANVHSPGITVASGSVIKEKTILGRALTACASGSIFTLDLDKRYTQVLSA